MDIFKKMLPTAKDDVIGKDEIAKLLGTNKEAFEAFEKAYANCVLDKPADKNDLFRLNSRQASGLTSRKSDNPEDINDLCKRIVNELLAQTICYVYDGSDGKTVYPEYEPSDTTVTPEEVNRIPKKYRPWLTGTAAVKDMNCDSYPMLLTLYKKFLESNDIRSKKESYHIFRQGLDILDVDPVMYLMIGQNQNSMGYWLPKLVDAVKKHGFFKIPKTTVVRVPLTLLQLTRCNYMSLNASTKKIVDDYCMKAFDLDVSKDYFIKTGTYSSKFDFRNCKVTGEKEVRELGEYLLFIHFQALQMASPLSRPCIYGASTTNEWVVREFITDSENNPTIYKGLPLHTEYRIFVDFDTDAILGVSPYWEPDTMKKRFSQGPDKNDPDMIHDYVIYKMHEEVLMKRYHENVNRVTENIKNLISHIDLPGQWSIDVMQNGNDFYIIDMAAAASSALKECVPTGLLKDPEEDWLPKLPEI